MVSRYATTRPLTDFHNYLLRQAVLWTLLSGVNSWSSAAQAVTRPQNAQTTGFRRSWLFKLHAAERMCAGDDHGTCRHISGIIAVGWGWKGSCLRPWEPRGAIWDGWAVVSVGENLKPL